MTSPERPIVDSTSAAGAMLRRQIREPVFVGCVLAAGLATSTADAAPLEVWWSCSMDQTSGGAAVPSVELAGSAIGELRRLSGLTWEQLARVLNVSRRSLHFWASGKPMASTNQEHLQRVLAVVRKIDRGSASANRAELLEVQQDGSMAIDLLTAGDYEGALVLVGAGEASRFLPPKLSEEARAARAPRPPHELVGALQDRIHRESGVSRAAKSVRVRGDRR